MEALMLLLEELKPILYNSDVMHLLIAAALGALIGLERELAGKDPSLRTFSLICTGSCLFTMLSVHSAEGVANAEPSRIAAQIVTGIGFVGAGAIFQAKDGVRGLTTASIIWAAAAIGMAVGFSRADLACFTTFFVLLINLLLNYVHRVIRYFRSRPHSSATVADE